MRGLVILMMMAIPVVTLGKTVTIDLPDMVKASDLIVKARVTSTRATEAKADYDLPVHAARFLIEETYKSELLPEIEIRFVPRLSISPEFQNGERYLLFLYRSNNELRPVQGYRGALRIEQRIYTGNVEGEVEWQDPNSFINRFKKLLSPR